MNDERMRRIALPLTITAGAYSANDVVGGLQEIAIPRNAAGFIRGVEITDDDNEKAGLKLYLFTSRPTALADNAAFEPTIDDLKNLFAIISIAAGDYSTINGNAKAIVSTNTSLDFEVQNQPVVFAYLVCDATPTYAATTDLTVHVRLFLT